MAESKMDKELQERMNKAIEEINETQKKYGVSLVAQLVYLPEGLIPKVSIIETPKEKESVMDKLK